MPRSKATTVAQYLGELTPERRAAISAVRDVVRKHLPAGYEESMQWGMISYAVPTKYLPAPYDKQPLGYVALAAQKNYHALYLMGLAGKSPLERAFKEAFRKAGKTLDMGKSCVRFQRVDDLVLDAVGRAVAAISMDRWIEIFRASRTHTARGK